MATPALTSRPPAFPNVKRPRPAVYKVRRPRLASLDTLPSNPYWIGAISKLPILTHSPPARPLPPSVAGRTPPLGSTLVLVSEPELTLQDSLSTVILLSRTEKPIPRWTKEEKSLNASRLHSPSLPPRINPQRARTDLSSQVSPRLDTRAIRGQLVATSIPKESKTKGTLHTCGLWCSAPVARFATAPHHPSAVCAA